MAEVRSATRWLPILVTDLSPAARYAIAVGAAAAGVLLRLAMDPVWANRVPFILAFPAIALSAWIGGFGPGMVTTILSAVGAAYFWFDPALSPVGFRTANSLELLAFVAMGAMLSALNETWRRGAVRVLAMERERSAMLLMERQAKGEAEAAVRQLEIALAAGRMGTWQWTMSTGEIKWSAGLEAIHGLEPGTFSGTFDAFRGEIHADDQTRVLEEIKEAVDQKRAHEIEYRIVRSDGSVRWVEGRGQLLNDASGRPERLVGVCTDTTERKLAEERLRQAKRLAEEASRMKGKFLAILSHELRTPLQSLLTYAHLLSEEALPAERFSQAVAAIQRNAQAQARLIESLLDLARIESGKLDLQLDRIDLGSIVLAAVDVVRFSADAKGLTLEVLCPTAPITTDGDGGRLQQVFWNLLTNAVKFTPAGGTIAVNLQRVNAHAEIRVQDSGQGINPEFLPNVFDPFAQAGMAPAGERSGLGLGLAIAQELVAAHGGSIAAESPGEGNGSTFTVTLPLSAHILDTDGHVPRFQTSDDTARLDA